MTAQDFTADLAAFDHAIASEAGPDAPWIALQDLTRKVIGAKLFTTMTVDMASELARRAYTSDPASYPASGTKPIHYDSWFDIVHKQRDNFVANTIEDIAKVFSDYELIDSLGCQSVINIPVEVGGELLGTVNCLDVAGHYTPERVAAAELLKAPARMAFLAAARQG
ncbi:GAF domain-containing protein [Rhizobium sp.]